MIVEVKQFKLLCDNKDCNNQQLGVETINGWIEKEYDLGLANNNWKLRFHFCSSKCRSEWSEHHERSS